MPAENPVRGLKADDLSLSEKGLPRPILELKESPDHLEMSPTELRRLFVVYFAADLTHRQLFRARRWLLRALPELRPNDAIAVYRSPRLSAFKSRRSGMKDLVRYFGVELFLGLPADSAYSPSPLALHPDLFTGRHPPWSRPAADELKALFDHGAQGDLMTVLGALRDVPGRENSPLFRSPTGPSGFTSRSGLEDCLTFVGRRFDHPLRGRPHRCRWRQLLFR